MSSHKSLSAAVRQARRSNRWQVERTGDAACVWAGTSRQPGPYGYGLYGDRCRETQAEALASARAEVARL